VDLDATIVIAHSDKEEAALTWKKTFGFHPLAAFADHGAAGNGEPLAIVLRAGSAGSNTAADHIEASRLALAQLPRHLRRRVMVRTDSGGGTRGFLEWLTARSRRLHYSVGMTSTEINLSRIPQADRSRSRRVGDWRGGSLALGPGAFVAAGFPVGCATPVTMARSLRFQPPPPRTVHAVLPSSRDPPRPSAPSC
jgi:Transposase DDE domain group 1